MEYSLAECKRCKIVFLPRSCNQKYCGSRKHKEGCSYQEYRLAQARSRKRLWNLDTNRAWNKDYYHRNKPKMLAWLKDYRKRTGRHDKKIIT